MRPAEIENTIQRAYEARLQQNPSGRPLGWRLLYSPRSVLEGARVAFIGLNPGGSTVDPEHGVFSSERGSAYRREVENWGASSQLQDQVLELFRRLNVSPEEVLAGNLVPFRSPSEATLEDAPGAIAFGKTLWAEILTTARPSVVVSMGGTANREVAQLLGVNDVKSHPVGWGNYTASRGRFPDGIWIGLPHLSRFAIMKRAPSQAALVELFRGLSTL
tara:strand:+ start:4654 stop:5307 length:654 start_codon:yes stop_codon:yes gene_type:complete